MLKDVGITVPKSGETSAVYVYIYSHYSTYSIYICTLITLHIYAATQGMRAVAIFICSKQMQQDRG